MTISIAIEGMTSRFIRQNTVDGGIRQLATGALFAEEQRDGFWKGLFAKIGNLLGQLFSISIEAIVSLFFRAAGFLYNFNWNIQDEQIKEIREGYTLRMASSAGDLAGQAAGWVTCGFVPGAVIFTFNEALALKVLRDVGEEAVEELAAQAAFTAREASYGALSVGFLYAYRSLRSWGKQKRVDILKSMKKDGLVSGAQVKAAEEDLANKEPWILREKVEKWIDGRQNPYARAFLESFIDSFGDSCMDAGYVVAGSIDSYITTQRIAAESTQQQRRVVEIELNSA